jgi:hypothetical protein
LKFLGSNFDTNWNFGVLILVSALEERKKQRKKNYKEKQKAAVRFEGKIGILIGK